MGKMSVSSRALVENEMNTSATYTPTPNDENGEQHIFFRQGSSSAPMDTIGDFMRKRTYLELLLLVVVALLFITLLLFIVVFTLTTSTRIETAENEKHRDMCLTETCVRVAGEILSKMNKSVDPCSDFYTYSCGKWLTETIPPDNYGAWNAFQELNEKLKLKTKRILDNWGVVYKHYHSPDDDDKKKEKAKKGPMVPLLDSQEKTYVFYRSCGGDARETLGAGPMLDVLNFTGGSTVFQDNVDIANFSVTDKKIIEKFGGSFFYDIGVYIKNSDTTKNIITISPRLELSLGSYSTYKNISAQDPRMKAFRYAMTEAFYLLTRSFKDLVLDKIMEERISKKVDEIMSLEVNFSKLITDPDKIQSMPTEKTYEITTLDVLKKKVPQIDWDGTLSILFEGIENITITDDEPIQLVDPDFWYKVGPFIDSSPKETLKNYLYWRVMEVSMNNINHEFEIIKANLSLIVKGSNNLMRPRWEQCVNYINGHNIVGNVVGAEFIRYYFRPESKKKIQDMIESIRQSFLISLSYLDWLDPATRDYAVMKAKAMHDFLAYPEELLNNTFVASLLSGVTFEEDAYYHNVIALGHFTSRQELLKLRKPVDKAEWEMTPQQINAYYVPSKNSFAFPAGILQKPFYSEEYPMSFNYGGVGVVVGHELTHGFDTQGRTYDMDGNQREWFKNETAEKFSNLSQCFVNQYSQYKVFNMSVDGLLTLGENIADNGGIKNSYQAYKKFEETYGKEPLYPGLELTHDQIFFVAFGQIWCNIQTEESARYRIGSDSHAPEEIRVPGAVSNLKEFADAFSCKKDAPMNPSKKCAIW